MNCPNCNEPIPESLLKKWWASLGGKRSKRKITPEQQAKMQAARLAKHNDLNQGRVPETGEKL